MADYTAYLREVLTAKEAEPNEPQITEKPAGTFREELDKVHHSLKWVVEDV